MSLDAKGVVVACGNCGQRNRIPYERLNSDVRCGQCKTALGLPAKPLEITSAETFRALTGNSPLPVFIDFWAPWCGPCKMVAPEIEKVAAAANRKFIVAKMNTDEVQEVAQEFQISSIPTMALFQRGRELERMAGARPAPALLGFIRETLQRRIQP